MRKVRFVSHAKNGLTSIFEFLRAAGLNWPFFIKSNARGGSAQLRTERDFEILTNPIYERIVTLSALWADKRADFEFIWS